VEERLKQELAMRVRFRNVSCRAISAIKGDYELFARCVPAREMSGDLYDFFPSSDGKLALFVGGCGRQACRRRYS